MYVCVCVCGPADAGQCGLQPVKGGADNVHEGGFDAVAELHVGVGSTQLLRRLQGESQLGGASSGKRQLLRVFLQVLQAWRRNHSRF